MLAIDTGRPMGKLRVLRSYKWIWTKFATHLGLDAHS